MSWGTAEPPINPPEETEEVDPYFNGYDTVKEAQGWA